MSIIEPKREDVVHPQHIKKNSSALRLWHWLNAVVITGSLLTVLVNSTLLKNKPGAKLTNNSSHQLLHGLRDQVWLVHTYLGYSLAALLLFRLLLEFFQVADQKFLRRLKSAFEKYQTIKKQRELARHEFWVKSIYAVFYLLLLTMVITGLCLAFEDDVPLLKSIHAFREIHSFTMYLILAFIIIHITGVVLAERKDSAGIVSDMINGGKE